LKKIQGLCQCQNNVEEIDKSLQKSDSLLASLIVKYDALNMMKNVNVLLKRLPSNWKATLIKLKREMRQKEKEAKEEERKNKEATPPPDGIPAEEEKTDGKEETPQDEKMDVEEDNEEAVETVADIEAAACQKEQFELDLERKIYETQMEEVFSLTQHLVMRIKFIKSQIDISKQLIKVILKMKREYEHANGRLKEVMSSCRCDAPEIMEGQEQTQEEAATTRDADHLAKIEEKKSLEAEVERLSNDLKYWEDQYQLMKEARAKKAAELLAQEQLKAQLEQQALAQRERQAISNTIIEVANEEEVGGHDSQHGLQTMTLPSSCMYASGHGMASAATTQGTTSPAVIYLDGLANLMSASSQQPTYIHNAGQVYQAAGQTISGQTYQIHTPGGTAQYHAAPDGSIQVYGASGDVNPTYVAYQ